MNKEIEEYRIVIETETGEIIFILGKDFPIESYFNIINNSKCSVVLVKKYKEEGVKNET